MEIEEYESEGEPDLKILSEDQRYGLLAPSTQRLLESMVKCGTQKVHEYKQEIEVLIERVNSGESLLTSKSAIPEVNQTPSQEQSVMVIDYL